jgi:hypothetical protein
MLLLRCPCSCNNVLVVPDELANQFTRCPYTSSRVAVRGYRKFSEDDWLSLDDIYVLLEFAGQAMSPRKLRLFSVACCRAVLPFLERLSATSCLDSAERFADSEVTQIELGAACQRIFDANMRSQSNLEYLGLCALRSTTGAPNIDVATATHIARQVVGVTKLAEASTSFSPAVMLRHFVGNPFRPCLATRPITGCVTELASSFYYGCDTAFALRDALLESNLSDLAQHFSDASHPKGCWALDLLLNRC